MRARSEFWPRFPNATEVAVAKAEAELEDGPMPSPRHAWFLRQLDTRRAARLARRYVDSCASAPNSRNDDRALPYAFLTLAEHEQAIGAPSQAKAFEERARAEFTKVDDLAGLSDCAWLNSHLFGDAPSRNRYMQQSLDLAVASQDPQRVDCAKLAMACFKVFDEDLDGAEACAPWVNSFANHEDPALRLLASTFLLNLACYKMAVPAAALHGAVSRDAALECGQISRGVQNDLNLAMFYLDVDHVQEALDTLNQWQEVVRAQELVGLTGSLLNVLSQVLVRLKRHQEAVAIAEEAVQLSQQSGSRRRTLIAKNTLGVAQIHAGQADLAANTFRELLTASEGAGDGYLRRYAVLGLAQAAEGRSDWSAAYAAATGVLKDTSILLDEAGKIDFLRIAARVANRYEHRESTQWDGPVPEHPEIWYLEAAANIQHAQRISGGDQLLIELARARAAAGDFKGSAEAAIAGYQALDTARSRDSIDRAALLEVRHLTDKARRDADLQRMRAEEAATRAAQLSRLNAKLTESLSQLEEAQRQLVDRNAELIKAHAQISELSLTDPLTGLRNRRYFSHAIDGCVSETLRAYSASTFGRLDPAFEDRDDLLLFMIDIDHFKSINDTYGHAAGDQLLKEVARRLTTVARSEDLLVRWGGEEFVLAVRHTDRRHQADIAQRILRAISAQPFQLTDDVAIQRTCSVGVQAYPVEPSDPSAGTVNEALEMADARLYEAKRSGRNRWCGAGSDDIARAA